MYSFEQFLNEQAEQSTVYVSRQNEFNELMSQIAMRLHMIFPLWKTYFDNMTVARVIPVKIDEPPPTTKPIRNQITIVKPNLPTMAVDAKGNIFVNESFALELPFNETFGVICHEIMHVVQFHLQRKESFRDMKVWNFATDYVINWQLMNTLNVRLPAAGLHAKPGTGEIELDGLTKTVSILDQSGNIRSAEEVYAMLLDAGIQDVLPDDGPSEFSPGDPGDGDPGDGGNLPEGFDKHIYGNELKDLAEKQGQKASSHTRDSWEQIKTDARQLDPTRGTKSGGKYDLDKAARADTDWRTVLRDVVSDMYETKSSYAKLRRGSYALRAPLKGRYKTKPKIGEIVAAIDTSGSTMNWQSMFLAEIHNLSNTFGVPIRTLMWDTNVGKDITLSGRWWQDNQTKERVSSKDVIEVTGGGGTDISCVKDYIDENGMRPKIIIYFTDGFVEANPRFYAPGGATHVFLITPGGDSSKFQNIGTIVNVRS